MAALTGVARLLVPALLVGQAAFAEPRLVGIGDLAGGEISSEAAGISGDGRVVVGSSVGPEGTEAVRFTLAGGIRGLGLLEGGTFSTAAAASGDGSVIVGRADVPEGSVAVRWSAAEGLQSLGDLAGGVLGSDAADVSADGSVIVGTGTTSPTGGAEPVFWTEAGGIQSLGELPAGARAGFPRAISADAGVVAGRVSGAAGGGIEAFRWTSGTGIVGLGDILLDEPPPGTTANGISADGGTLVGFSSGNGPATWSEAEGWRLLALPDFADAAGATDADAGGSRIVGSGTSFDFDTLTFESRALMWDRDGNVSVLEDYIAQELGLDLAGWSLTAATAISDDGSRIVGQGTNPLGQVEGWLLIVPEPATGLLVLSGVLALAVAGRRPITWRAL